MVKEFKYYQYVYINYNGMEPDIIKFVSDEEITFVMVRNWLKNNKKHYHPWISELEFIDKPKTEIL